jgi:NAD(P)-dependent dehydrogenase (short-subunit alcohol dehydrogenase family)
MLKLAGRGALLIGAKRVGAVVAERLAAEGVNLAIAYRNSRDEAEKLRAAVAPRVARSCVLQADASVEDDVRRLVEEAAAQLGDLSFLVNLASDFPRATLAQLDGAAWDRAMAQARASYLSAVYAARHMAARNEGPTRGHVVLFSDWAADETPYRHHLPYLTAKAAIDFMTRAFAVELAPQGILVNAIAPGPTMRPPDMSEEAWAREAVARTPLQRESSPLDIAEIVVTLLKSETITGETIRVDAGRHLAGPGPH